MSTPIYDALRAGRRSDRPSLQRRTSNAAPLEFNSLVAELDACAEFADGTRRGALVPLADFTRHRIARALREGSQMLVATRRVEHGGPPGVAVIGAERSRQMNEEGHDQAADVGRSRELMAAAEAYLSVAALGADAFIHPDGRYAPPGGWPWSEASWRPTDNPISDLAKAGALIAAAIDALHAPIEGRTRRQHGDTHLIARTTH